MSAPFVSAAPKKAIVQAVSVGLVRFGQLGSDALISTAQRKPLKRCAKWSLDARSDLLFPTPVPCGAP